MRVTVGRGTSICEALDPLRHSDIHVLEHIRESLPIVRHRVRIPVGGREHEAVLTVTQAFLLDVESHHPTKERAV